MLQINFKKFQRTHEKKHVKNAQNIFSLLLKKKTIYQDNYKGLYCENCEEFKLDREKRCVVCQAECHKIKEKNYFLNTQIFATELKKIYQKENIKIIPAKRKEHFLKEFFGEKIIKNISITRRKLK
jgi:methionyl-tRNA synthetase